MEETIQVRKLFAEIRYMYSVKTFSPFFCFDIFTPFLKQSKGLFIWEYVLFITKKISIRFCIVFPPYIVHLIRNVFFFRSLELVYEMN